MDESAAGLIWLVEEAWEALEDETGGLLAMVGGFDMFLGTDGQRRRQEEGGAAGGRGGVRAAVVNMPGVGKCRCRSVVVVSVL